MALPIWQRTITDNQGNVIPSAEVLVVVEATGLEADIFSNRSGTTPRTNPFFTGSDGFAQFYAAPGEYRIEATGPTGSIVWRWNVLVSDIAIKNTGTGASDVPTNADLGTMSTQNANNVNITGGSVSVPNLTATNDADIHGLTVGRGGIGNINSTAIGRAALQENTTGDSNTANGAFALRENTTGESNTANGRSALVSNTTGSVNTANGRDALLFNTTGDNNTANGHRALRDNTTGINNIGIGSDAGRVGSPFTVTTQDNRIVMGNNSHTDAYIRIAWTVTSDARDKAATKPIPHGLDFVNQLKPTEYQFKVGGRDGDPDGRRRYGFLAQDVLAAEGDNPVIADAEDPENLKLHESYLVPVLVNAIKELTARIEELEQKS